MDRGLWPSQLLFNINKDLARGLEAPRSVIITNKEPWARAQGSLLVISTLQGPQPS